MKLLLRLFLLLSAILHGSTIIPAQNPDEPNPNKRTAQQSGQEESSAKKQKVEAEALPITPAAAAALSLMPAAAPSFSLAPDTSSSSSNAPMETDEEFWNSLPIIEPRALITHSNEQEKKALVNAIKQDNVDAVIAHLTHFPQDITLTDDTGKTLLILAILHNALKSFTHILNRTSSENLNAQNHKGKTALFYAAQKSPEKFITLLLNKGANVHITDNSGCAALYYALHGLNPKNSKLLMQHGATREDIESFDFADFIFYIHATYGEDYPLPKNVLETFHFLIDNGVDINEIDQHVDEDENEEAHNSITRATMYGMYELVEALIVAGADMVSTDDDKTLINIAEDELHELHNIKGKYSYNKEEQEEYDDQIYAYTKIIQLLSDPLLHGPSRQRIAHTYLEKKHNVPQDLTNIMGEYLTGPSKSNRFRINLIKNALQTDDIEELTSLLNEFQSAPFSTDEAGDTPLLLAIKWEKPAAVEKILQIFKQQIEKVEDRHEKIYLIAEQEEQYDKARTLAEKLGNQAIIKLIDQYTNASAASSSNTAPIEPLNLLPQNFIQYLTVGGKEELEAIKSEISYHPEYLNGVDKDGNTPLMIAAEHGHNMIVETLLELGADRNVQNNAGKTTLQIAQESLGLANEPARQQRLQDIIVMLNN